MQARRAGVRQMLGLIEFDTNVRRRIIEQLKAGDGHEDIVAVLRW